MRHLLTLLVFVVFCAACGNHPAQTTTSTRKEDEKESPEAFIKVNYEVRKNLVGKKIVEGEVLNTGKYLTYSAVTLKIVSYLDGDEQSVPYTVPGPIAPGGKVDFRYKPEGNPEKVTVAVSGASEQ